MSAASKVPLAAIEDRTPTTLALSRAVRPMVLAYHELSADATGYRYELSCRQFEDHLKLASQLALRVSDGNSPLAISFDDGHISNYRHALPLLERYSCKAIFFVITSRIGTKPDFMNWAQLREIVTLGHEVQSHGWSHRFLTECSGADLREELTCSRKTLENRLGTAVESLSAPHGRWDQRVVQACAAAGYRRLYTSDPWQKPQTFGSLEVIGRLIMVQSMDTDQLLRRLTMSRSQAFMGGAKDAMKRSLRRTIGEKLYYRLWARFSGWNGMEDRR